MASQRRWVFVSDGISGRLSNFVSVLVGFGVVVGGNGETVEISVFDAHGLSFGDGFIAGVLSRAESFNRERFARIRVNERDNNFDGDEIFDVAFSSRDLLFVQNVGNNNGSKTVFCKRSIDFFKHISGSGVLVFVKLVGTIFCDVGAVAHDFDEFLGDVLHE